MLKSYTYLLAIAFAFSSLGLSAQSPVLADWTSNPVVGDQFEYYGWDLPSSGQTSMPSSGANASWDYSNPVYNDTFSYSVVATAGVPRASYFPNSQVALLNNSTGRYLYARTTNSLMGTFGEDYFGDDVIVYEEELPYLLYPVSYPAAATFDTIAGHRLNVVTGDTIADITTLVEYEVEGYGTLDLSYGTFTDVMLVRRKESQTAIDTNGTSTSTDFTVYTWWVPGTHLFIHQYAELILFGTLTSLNSTMNPQFVANDPAYLNQASFFLFPNPAADQSHVRFTLERPGAVTVRLLDLQGRTMHVEELGKMPAGTHETELDLSDLASGLYLFELLAGDQKLTRKLQVR